MGALVVLAAQAGSIEPGAEAESVVLVRNTGDAVDQFHVTVQGPAARWSAVDPQVLTIEPGAEAASWVRFRPPRAPDTMPGTVPFTVVVAPRSDPAAPISEPGALSVGTYAAVEAAVISSRSLGPRASELVVAVRNTGNRRAQITVDAEPGDDGAGIEVRPRAFDLGPGERAESTVAVDAPRRLLSLRGPDRSLVVSAVSDGGALATIRTEWSNEVSLRHELMRSARLLGLALVVLAVGGLALLRSETDSGTVDVTRRSGEVELPSATTTTAAPGDDAGGEAAPTSAPDAGRGAARPAAAPSLPKLVFVRVYGPDARDVVVRDAGKGGGELRLRSDGVLESRPRLAPDGASVAFIREHDSTWRVCVISTGGGDAVCLADTTADASVVWTKDGRGLLFSRGQRLFRISYDASTQTAGDEAPIDVDVPGGAFDLSPDGSRIVAADRARLVVRPVDGGDGLSIAVPGSPSDPHWSPDGSRIAYVADFQLYSAPVGSGPIRQMTAPGTVNGEPAWTGDGDWVVFRSNRSGNGDLYAVHGGAANGNEDGLARVTSSPDRDTAPSF